MANTKISQLPIYSGSAADLRWFVMNDSAETTTFKFSGYSSQLIPGTGIDSYRTLNAGAVTGQDSIAIGANGGASAQNSINIGGSDGATAFKNITIGNNPVIGGASSIIIGNGSYSSGSGIVLGNETACYSNCIVIGNGLDANRATGLDGLGGFAITVGTDNPQNNGSYGGIFGNKNRIGNFTYNSQSYNNGGTYNFIISNNSRLGFLNATNYTGNTILGGNENIIIASGNTNTIVGGGGNVISGATSGSTLIGLNNFTEPLLNDTAYVNNLQVLRTPSTRVQSVSSGTTFTCNLDNGAKSQFYITGTSTINITNVRDGASFMIKTQTTGNYNITWTATGGYTFVFEGGIKDPGNTTTDIFVFEVFGSVIYGNRRHNYS